MKTYKAKFNPKKNGGVYAISLVESPAMEGLFVALSKDEPIQLKEIDSEKRILIGLVLEPNKPIYRNQNGEEFNIVFDEETIEELSHSFFKNGYQKNSTIEHESEKIQGVTFVESWIIEDEKNDKSNALGFSYPKGSWMATMKVDSDEVWENYVKTGKVQGFSIDAFLSLEEVNLKSNIIMSKQEETSLIQLLKDLPKQISDALGLKKAEIKLGQIKTQDESAIIMYDGEMMEVGNRVWIVAEDGTEVPLPAGEYLLENESTLVVKEDGIIDSLVMPMEEVAEEVVEEEMAKPESEGGKVNNDAKIASEIENAIKSILIKYSEQQAEIVNLKKQIEEIGQQPASKGIKQSEVKVDLSSMTKKERILFNLKNN